MRINLPELLKAKQTPMDSGVTVSAHAFEKYRRRVSPEATIAEVRQHFLRCEPALPYVVRLALQYADPGARFATGEEGLEVAWDLKAGVVFTNSSECVRKTIVSVYCLAELERFDETGQFVPT